MSEEKTYYLKRASQETQAAIDAAGHVARYAHLELADRYLALALGEPFESVVLVGPWSGSAAPGPGTAPADGEMTRSAQTVS